MRFGSVTIFCVRALEVWIGPMRAEGTKLQENMHIFKHCVLPLSGIAPVGSLGI